MSLLDDHIKPGERVVWRTEGLRRAALGAAGWAAMLGVFSAVTVFWLDDGFPVLILLLVAVVLFAQWGGRPAEACLTDRRVLFLRGVLRPEITAFDRSDVVRVELYDGDDTVILHGRGAPLYRAPVLEPPDPMLTELGHTIAFWGDRDEARRFGFTLLPLILTLLAPGILLTAAMFAPLVFGVDGLRALRELLPPGESWSEVFVTTGIAMVILLGVFIGLAVMALLRRIWLTPEEMESFRRAVRFPAWTGHDPLSPLQATLPHRVYRALRLSLDRLLYGRPPEPPTVEPRMVEPAALDDLRD